MKTNRKEILRRARFKRSTWLERDLEHSGLIPSRTQVCQLKRKGLIHGDERVATGIPSDDPCPWSPGDPGATDDQAVLELAG